MSAQAYWGQGDGTLNEPSLAAVSDQLAAALPASLNTCDDGCVMHGITLMPTICSKADACLSATSGVFSRTALWNS